MDRPWRAVVLDLDGTLLDTQADIADAANAVLADLQCPPHPEAEYRSYIGEGVVRLFERALPPELVRPDMLERAAASFQEHYGRGWKKRTRLYEGIPEMLNEFELRGLSLAVLSNKPHEFTVACVRHFLADWPFAVVLGQRFGFPRKPDPAGALEVAERMEVEPGECLYLGDTAVDMQTALSAGMFPVGVTWGFRDRAELESAGARQLLDQPLEIFSGWPRAET